MIGPERYSTENFQRLLRNPKLLFGEFRRVNLYLNRTLSGTESVVDVMERDWDNLLILDGCRFDLFEEVNELDGELEKLRSETSHSREFIEHQFKNKELHDTVYVTSNPYSGTIEDGTFHAVIDLLDKWDESTQTILPETVVQEAISVLKRFENKRVIVHFMQPHYPFIGQTGQQIEHRGFSTDPDGRDVPSIWKALMYGMLDINDEVIWRAYRENLEIVLEQVQILIDNLSGRTVISADHGNLIGDRIAPLYTKVYGHPEGVRAPGVNTVPWHSIQGVERREIISEPPIPTEPISDETVQDRLEALGYAE